MTAETILTALFHVNLEASVAILVVLALRPWVRRAAGARVSYWLWLIVPIAAIAGQLPASTRVVVAPVPDVAVSAEESVSPTSVQAAASEQIDAGAAVMPLISFSALAELLVAIWLLVAGALFVRSIVSMLRLAADPSVGPALVGVLRTRLVLPIDFETRFDAEERTLILAHEEMHRVSAHTLVNALIEVARCACWFNPLAHLAAARTKEDQELACDAAVLATRPAARRTYAEALLKAQVRTAFMPLGCTWTSPSGKRLADRITMLGRRPPSRCRTIAGVAALAVVGLATGYAAWAQQPERLVTQRPEPVWTPAAEAPEGLLTALGGKRHDVFIARAQKGDIDFVFFGTTETEMWLWPDRGRAVWDREFAWRKAADFGSQGKSPKGLLWGMRNGELDGYEAKLVVLQLPWHDLVLDYTRRGGGEFIELYAPIIAEIRARQPEAKILLTTPIPRGLTPSDSSRESWRQVADANAAVIAHLTDGKTVFYDDLGERFFLPDGSYNQHYWNGPAGAGIQPPAFEVLAKELKPWIDRFVR
jgi:beta-lactamase regulating signal transducer with metallopeptidase domain